MSVDEAMRWSEVGLAGAFALLCLVLAACAAYELAVKVFGRFR